MPADLDLQRLRALEPVLGTELADIVATLRRELDHALAGVDTALAAGELGAAADAAHAARNSALMLGPGPLLDALAGLERAAAGADADAARSATRRVQRAWPPVRAALDRAERLT